MIIKVKTLFLKNNKKKNKLYEYGDVHVMELQTACQWWVTASWPWKILRFSSNHTLVEVIHNKGPGMYFPSRRW